VRNGAGKNLEKSLPKEFQWEGEGAKREKEKGKSCQGHHNKVNFGIQEKRQEKGESLEPGICGLLGESESGKESGKV
jgi:hypothetical protein